VPTAPANDAWAALWEFFATHSVDAILSGEATSEDPAVAKAIKHMGHKSPAALRLAERLMDAGAEVSLADGLAGELASLEEVFSNPDALEGLSALIEGRRPSFLHSGRRL
jgi:enoyl-CoA hydratase/carnithine racemase